MVTNTFFKKIHVILFGFVFLLSCSGKADLGLDLTTSVPPTALVASEVQSVVQASATAVDNSAQAIAVVDRRGVPLAVFSKTSATADTLETALSLARTGAFFSNDQAPLSSRTVSFISREHFPPGIDNTASGALFGIEHTNRGCSFNTVFAAGKSVTPATAVDGVSSGKGITVSPGGVPLFRSGRLVGGLGVAGGSDAENEFAAFQGLSLFAPTPADPGVIFIDGVVLPFVEQTTQPAGTAAGSLTGTFVVASKDGGVPSEGELVTPKDSPTADSPKLLASDVTTIINNAIATANKTRGLIRLPIGQRAKMSIAVTDLSGNILGLHRMTDSTIFSLDVSVAKARNVTYFSGASVATEDQISGIPLGTAITNRTIGFGSQPFFPSGINGTDPGPFRDIFTFDATHPCTQGRQAANANQNGIVFFPGSSPLYKDNGSGTKVLVGGLGVSGDGVEQDDYVTAGGLVGYEPPESIRADQILVRNVRLPFFKFPRNPED